MGRSMTATPPDIAAVDGWDIADPTTDREHGAEAC
jgi:hypothetical protein